MMSGSSLRPSALLGFSTPNTVIPSSIMSPLLLPKNSTLFHIPVMCELCKQNPRFCWWITVPAAFCKLSVQDICTFSTYGINLYQLLSLGVQITFHPTKCYDWLYLELGICIFNTSNCQSYLLCLGKRTMKSTDKKKDSVDNWG